MKITSNVRAYTEYVSIEGRLDANSSDEFDIFLQEIDPMIREVVLDLSKLTYISSMGLRVILQEYKSLSKHRKKLVIKNIPENIRAIFEMSGFIQTFIKEEKLVVVVKEENNSAASYTLGGILDADTIPALAQVVKKVEDSPIRRIEFLCEKLHSISAEGCMEIKKIDGLLKNKNGSITLLDVSEQVFEEAKNQGYDGFFKQIARPPAVRSDLPKEIVEPLCSSGKETELYTLQGIWGGITLPQFDDSWRALHTQTKRVILDLKGVTGISTEGFAALMDLKMSAQRLALQIELVM